MILVSAKLAKEVDCVKCAVARALMMVNVVGAALARRFVKSAMARGKQTIMRISSQWS